MRIHDYQRVYKCTKCSAIQESHNCEICQKCGNKVEDCVARWINTTTFWQDIFWQVKGHWEEHHENSK